MAGDLDAATAVAADLSTEELSPDATRWVSVMVGSVALASGRVDDAVRQLRGALSSHRHEFLGGWLCRYFVDLAIALAVRGEPQAAARSLERMHSLPHPDVVHSERTMVMLATAWISASTGAVSRAIGEARAAAAHAATLGLTAREVVCLQTATRFGDPTTAARLHELAATLGGRRVSAAAAHAAALADDDGEALLEVSGRYATQDDALSALDAAAQASAAFKRADRRGSALGALGRMRELCDRCGDVRTPAVAGASAPVVFTGREREVIMLAGTGLTNREIAQRLHLSVRTVEGHLYRAAGRVGARDRNELARTITEGLAEPA